MVYLSAIPPSLCRLADHDTSACLQDLYAFELVLAELMGLTADAEVESPQIALQCGRCFLGWDLAQMGVYVTHYQHRVCAKPHPTSQ